MLYAIVAVLALILDQGVKYWVTVTIDLETGLIPLIKGVLSLVNVHNYGAAFGFLQNANAAWLFIALAVVFTGVVVFALAKNLIRDPLGRWSALLVMAGAVGNCIDRVINGYVVDMFQLEFMNFAVFNVADIFITVCGILFCVYIIFGRDFGEKAPAKAGGPSKKPPRKAKPERPAAPEPMEGDEDVKVAPPKAKAPVDSGEVRTYQPRPKSAPVEKPAPAPAVRDDPGEPAPVFAVPDARPVEFDPTSPFAEWESKPAAPVLRDEPAAAVAGRGEPGAPSIIIDDPGAPPSSFDLPDLSLDDAAADGEFSLDDILAEFSSK